MNEFAEYILKTLNYPCGEMSFCGKNVITAADIPQLRVRDIAKITPDIYDMTYFGHGGVAPVLWEKLLILWVFDDAGFDWNDFGVYLETGDEAYVIPHVIRKPLQGFEAPITWSGADCDPYTMLCLGRYYDYGTVCIRFLRKWRIQVDKLYNDGHDVFADKRVEYNTFLSKVTQRVTELTRYMVDFVTKLPDFQEHIRRTSNSVYHELAEKSTITSEELDLLFDVLDEFFTEFCKVY